jgi:VWFA-related protein
MRVSVVGLAGLVAVSSVALLSQGQQDRPIFKTGVELVQLDVVVLDGKRQPVKGLTAADFTVLDNGAPAAIRAFTPVELARGRPSEAVWAGDVDADVTTNRVADDEGRLVVILMDRSIPPGDPVVKARKIANAAVDALGPSDLAAIVSTSNNAVQSGLVQSLTSDRSRLKRTIDGGDPSTGISAEAEGLMNKDGFQMTAMNDTRCPCGTCVLETMTRVAAATQYAQRRRKLLLFVGSNIIWQTWAPASAGASNIGCEGRLKDARNAMFAAVDRANLTVHSIDPQGLVNDSPQSGATPRTGPPRSAIDKLQAGIASSMRERENLTVLPERTGGRTIVARNEPEEFLPDILRESETYYVIGIERAVSKRADGARSIEVKVGRKGLRVVAPREYLGIAPVSSGAAASPGDDSKASPVDDALTRLLPNSALPLSLALTTFAPVNAGKPVVRVNVDAGAFAHADGTDAPLDVVVIAVDQGGKVVASARQKSTISSKRAAGGSPTEINVQSQLELEPGTYDIRVAVSDPATGRVASVFSNLAVVPYTDAPVSLSSVSVESSSAGRAPVPTTRRSFRRSDGVRAVFQIYQGTERRDALAPVSMRVRILDAKGAAVRDESLPFAESAFTNRRTDCVITLPLSKLAPGEYLLKLDATIGQKSSGRALRFSVE